MKTQKIIKLLDHKDEDDPRFETGTWYIVNDHNNGNYSQGDDVRPIVKFDTEILDLFCVIILMLIFQLRVILKCKMVMMPQE